MTFYAALTLFSGSRTGLIDCKLVTPVKMDLEQQFYLLKRIGHRGKWELGRRATANCEGDWFRFQRRPPASTPNTTGDDCTGDCTWAGMTTKQGEFLHTVLCTFVWFLQGEFLHTVLCTFVWFLQGEFLHTVLCTFVWFLQVEFLHTVLCTFVWFSQVEFLHTVLCTFVWFSQVEFLHTFLCTFVWFLQGEFLHTVLCTLVCNVLKLLRPVQTSYFSRWIEFNDRPT